MQTDKQHRIMDSFRQADQILKRSIGRKVKDTGLFRSQHRILMILGKHPDCSQTNLAEKLDVSPAAVAVALKKLEKAGYISRQCDVDDNRMNHVVVTEKGMKAIKTSIVYFQEIESAMLEDFSKEELDMLESYFKRIIKNGETYYQTLMTED